ncbi:pyrimidine 5'-nucleotidase [Shewanella algae]|uniref:pyrimidine 5'-nucleotidase n=1 Tax=Shewanella algae TaxID=38313 RepID=UPI0031F53A9E
MPYSNSQAYQWVLFDADETLFQFDAPRGLKLMFSRQGVDFSNADYAEYQQTNAPLWVAYQDGKISASELQLTRFSHWAKRLGRTPFELNSAFMTAMADICEPLPGAAELLDSLKGRARLGIITNGFTELQQVRLQKTGFAEHFDLLVISEEVGLAKPDPGIFEHALAKMQQPERKRVLMVGDNPHSDILGGLQAGLDTCWLNVKGEAAPEGIKPHIEVRSLSELQRQLCS